MKAHWTLAAILSLSVASAGAFAQNADATIRADGNVQMNAKADMGGKVDPQVAKDVRNSLANTINHAASKDGVKELVQNLAQEDQKRIDTQNLDVSKLNETLDRFRTAFRQKYNQDFDFKAAYLDNAQIVAGPDKDHAILVLAPAKNADRPRALEGRQDQLDIEQPKVPHDKQYDARRLENQSERARELRNKADQKNPDVDVRTDRDNKQVRSDLDIRADRNDRMVRSDAEIRSDRDLSITTDADAPRSLEGDIRSDRNVTIRSDREMRVRSDRDMQRNTQARQDRTRYSIGLADGGVPPPGIVETPYGLEGRRPARGSANVEPDGRVDRIVGLDDSIVFNPRTRDKRMDRVLVTVREPDGTYRDAAIKATRIHNPDLEWRTNDRGFPELVVSESTDHRHVHQDMVFDSRNNRFVTREDFVGLQPMGLEGQEIGSQRPGELRGDRKTRTDTQHKQDRDLKIRTDTDRRDVNVDINTDRDQPRRLEGDVKVESDRDQPRRLEGDVKVESDRDLKIKADADQSRKLEGDMKRDGDLKVKTDVKQDGDLKIKSDIDQPRKLEGDMEIKTDSKQGDLEVKSDLDQPRQLEGDAKMKADKADKADKAGNLYAGLNVNKVALVNQENKWAIDISDDINGNDLVNALNQHFTDLLNQQAAWPADAKDAYKLVGRHTIQAMYDTKGGKVTMD